MCIFFLVILVAFGPCLDIYDMCIMFLVEGSLEVKLPTIWTVEKQR